MPRIRIIEVACSRAPGTVNTQLRITRADGTASSHEHELASGQTWQASVFVDYQYQAVVSLVDLTNQITVGYQEIDDEETGPAEDSSSAPQMQFSDNTSAYTVRYEIIETPDNRDEAQSPAQDGFCVAPNEENRVRAQLPMVLAYYPTAGRGHGTFRSGAEELVADLQSWRNLPGETIAISGNETAMRNAILADLQEREPAYSCLPREERLRELALCCHGFTTGLQFGFQIRTDAQKAHVDRMLDLVSEMSRDDVKVVMYACSTGSPAVARQGNHDVVAHNRNTAQIATRGGIVERWGMDSWDHDMGGRGSCTCESGPYSWWQRIREAARDYDRAQLPHEAGRGDFGLTSFAAYLRDGLSSRGRGSCQVYGHSDVSHGFTFPGVLRFSGGGSGAQWVVEPGSEGGSREIRAFQQTMAHGAGDPGTRLRYRFPWMSSQEILNALELSDSED